MIKSSLFEHALFCVIWNGKIFVFSSVSAFQASVTIVHVYQIDYLTHEHVSFEIIFLECFPKAVKLSTKHFYIH